MGEEGEVTEGHREEDEQTKQQYVKEPFKCKFELHQRQQQSR